VGVVHKVLDLVSEFFILGLPVNDFVKFFTPTGHFHFAPVAGNDRISPEVEQVLRSTVGVESGSVVGEQHDVTITADLESNNRNEKIELWILV